MRANEDKISKVSWFGVFTDYISLTKPGVMSLLLVSTVCPMVLASSGAVDLKLMFWVLIGGALVSGSASAINCIWDRDIDQIMQRTKTRPLPSGRLTSQSALIFSLMLGLAGLLVLGYLANPVAALVALSGHLFYVFIYTIWLKRATPQNIVIGGAAGAIPPLVGWVAVTGNLNLTAILLFLVVFIWTPPHFWALALNKNTDYKNAGVPMLPVVSGEAATHRQMLYYAIALIPTSVLLVLSDSNLGYFSLSAFLLLSSVFAFKVWRLSCMQNSSVEVKTKQAWSVFSFSLIYLALFFASLVIDSTII
jgi:protoheme IX farnesyltransferase